MAVIFRYVYSTFWEDPFIQEIPPEDKYFYLYAITNPHTNQCGIYQITRKTMSFETGYNNETINKLLTKFADYKKILYNETVSELFVINWLRYNGTKSPKIAEHLNEELRAVKTLSFRNTACRVCLERGYPIDTVYIGYQDIDIDIDIDIDKDIEVVKKAKTPAPVKNKYGEFQNIYLTDEEHQKLETKLNSQLPTLIENMSAWLKQNGKSYKDYYAALLNWSRKEVKGNSGEDKKAWNPRG